MSDKENKGLRVFIDTNILISAVLSETSLSAKLLRYVIEEHELVICSYTLTEASKVIERKFPQRLSLWDKFLTSLEFELTYTPSDLSLVHAPPIRDKADLPILISAIVAQPDFLVTGDYDFHTPDIREYFTILTPADFLRSFGQEMNH
ncbi:putative toxin-antitoxin system toxin component, PIN family [Cohnella fermenti]|uniref:Putative toxin-antitoxin system toxin component, PIN family n=1 Tax=Cohnella fermenti TaxID=2565925 RepID=A0A4S4BFL5_9BACL|nr:putative toxin-antitoxin system toxin component, PIN family [Cohnella fermenti]THF73137.1 putative toxin-antitoxin system toxin component, PIN family [Cohnella fermenti]